MTYVIDTSAVSALHKNYFQSRFVSLWARFDELVASGGVTSTREVLRELEDYGGAAYEWAENHSGLFATPEAIEGAFVAKIFSVRHFQANMERQKIMRGGRNADPFWVARAAAVGGTVLTIEKLKQNSAKLPNICQHFSIPCMDLEQFMEAEGWVF